MPRGRRGGRIGVLNAPTVAMASPLAAVVEEELGLGSHADLCTDVSALSLHAAIAAGDEHGVQCHGPDGVRLHCFDGVRVCLCWDVACLCTDVAALSLHAAVAGGDVRGAQQAGPNGLSLLCFDGVCVGLMSTRDRVRLAELEERARLLRAELGADRADRVLRAVECIQGWFRSAVRYGAGGYPYLPCRRPGPGSWRRMWATVPSCGWHSCNDVMCTRRLLTYVPRRLLPRLHTVWADSSVDIDSMGLHRCIKHWCAAHPSADGALVVPEPTPCSGRSLLQHLTDLTPSRIALAPGRILPVPQPLVPGPMLMLPSLGGTQSVPTSTPMHLVQIPPLQVGASALDRRFAAASAAAAAATAAAAAAVCAYEDAMEARCCLLYTSPSPRD